LIKGNTYFHLFSGGFVGGFGQKWLQRRNFLGLPEIKGASTGIPTLSL